MWDLNTVEGLGCFSEVYSIFSIFRSLTPHYCFCIKKNRGGLSLFPKLPFCPAVGEEELWYDDTGWGEVNKQHPVMFLLIQMMEDEEQVWLQDTFLLVDAAGRRPQSTESLMERLDLHTQEVQKGKYGASCWNCCPMTNLCLVMEEVMNEQTGRLMCRFLHMQNFQILLYLCKTLPFISVDLKV